jgi:hypothetical protein
MLGALFLTLDRPVNQLAFLSGPFQTVATCSATCVALLDSHRTLLTQKCRHRGADKRRFHNRWHHQRLREAACGSPSLARYFTTRSGAKRTAGRCVAAASAVEI